MTHSTGLATAPQRPSSPQPDVSHTHTGATRRRWGWDGLPEGGTFFYVSGVRRMCRLACASVASVSFAAPVV